MLADIAHISHDGKIGLVYPQSSAGSHAHRPWPHFERIFVARVYEAESTGSPNVAVAIKAMNIAIVTGSKVSRVITPQKDHTRQCVANLHPLFARHRWKITIKRTFPSHSTAYAFPTLCEDIDGLLE